MRPLPDLALEQADSLPMPCMRLVEVPPKNDDKGFSKSEDLVPDVSLPGLSPPRTLLTPPTQLPTLLVLFCGVFALLQLTFYWRIRSDLHNEVKGLQAHWRQPRMQRIQVEQAVLGDYAQAERVLVLLGSILGAVSAIAFFIWVYQAWRCIQLLGVPALTFSPVSALLAYFIPMLNLVAPPFMLAELHKASNPFVEPGENWRARPAHGLIPIWWLAVLVGVACDVLSRFQDETQSALTLVIVSRAAAAVGGLSLCLLMNSIHERLRKKILGPADKLVFLDQDHAEQSDDDSAPERAAD